MVESINVAWRQSERIAPYKNIDFLGRCYDFIKLNPLDLSQRVRDGGGTMTAWAVTINSDDCTVLSPDGQVYIPKGSKYISESRGERTSQAKRWFSAYDFSRSFSNTVTAGISIPGLMSFSASTTYREFYRTTGSNEFMETFVQGYFEDCSVRLNDNFIQDLKLDQAFVSAVKNLNSQSSYNEFIKTYGTHYAHEVTFGGRMYQRIQISTQTYKRLVEKGVDVSVSAEASYKKATGSLSSGSSSSSSSSLENEQGVSINSIQWAGGTPNTNFDEWVKTIRDDPKPTQMDLIPLYQLFTSKYFPDDSQIDQKRQLMEKTVKTYIEQNAHIEPNPANLANKVVYIRNRWRADIGERRVDMHLSFDGENIKLYPRDNTYDLVPWKLVPVPGKTDEYYIRNRWRAEFGERRADMHLSFYGEDVKLFPKDNTYDLVPWKFIPVPGKTDEYYIRSRWRAEFGDKRADMHLSFYGEDVKLFPKDNLYDLVPWKLIIVN
ncbi:MAC/perforin domain-containing protein [Anabaena azotica]|uniref:Phospholipase n=1 Tax=Anabaena azotica FACHB-119 TaxID=947527 RepID=A0ABR8DE53_9NOST|nr:MAC/perforin domain-containing protein [Anabaena azotica]MBD2505472.1 phospholipase [Anabaena azotica FACHB-119]